MGVDFRSIKRPPVSRAVGGVASASVWYEWRYGLGAVAEGFQPPGNFNPFCSGIGVAGYRISTWWETPSENPHIGELGSRCVGSHP
jgi:hypothetical protein